MRKPKVNLDRKPTKRQIRARLEWVKKQITEHPETYDQGSFCGTACCIAGHLAILAAGKVSDGDEVRHIAKKTIGLDPAKGLWLFGFRWSHLIDHLGILTPEDGCRAIDYYLAEIGA